MKRIAENTDSGRRGWRVVVLTAGLAAVVSVGLWESFQPADARAESPGPKQLMNAGSQRVALLRAQEQTNRQLAELGKKLDRNHESLEALKTLFEEGKAVVVVQDKPTRGSGSRHVQVKKR